MEIVRFSAYNVQAPEMRASTEGPMTTSGRRTEMLELFLEDKRDSFLYLEAIDAKSVMH